MQWPARSAGQFLSLWDILHRNPVLNPQIDVVILQNPVPHQEVDVAILPNSGPHQEVYVLIR